MLFTLTPAAQADGYAEAIVPLAEVKAWVRVVTDDEDVLIAALRDAAVDFVEQYCNVRLGPVTGLVATFAAFGGRMRPGIGPVSTVKVTAIDYVDADGAEAAIEGGGWRVGQAGDVLPAIGTAWPSGGSDVAVTFDAGYPAGACPPMLVTAAKMFVAFLYDAREGIIANGMTADAPLGVTRLCDRYRMPVL